MADDERALFERILRSPDIECLRRHREPHALARAAVGASYEGALMIVGRSAHGGRPEFGLNAIDGAESVTRILAAPGDDTDLDTGGATNRRIGRQAAAMIGLGSGAASWESQVVWTYLYRLASSEGGGPAPQVQLAQARSAVELLPLERARHRPRRMLVLTGWDAFMPFAERLSLEFAAEPGGLVEVVGRAQGTLVIVARDLRGQPEAEVLDAVRPWLAPGAEVMSLAQQRRFEAAAGYPWDGVSTKGQFSTDCPNGDRASTGSPWSFRFKLRPEDGNLFLELEHRMTNNRPSGFDREGNPLPGKLVESVFPSHI